MTQMKYQVTWTAMVDTEVKPWLRCNASGHVLVTSSLLPAALGSQLSAASLSVVPASDSTFPTRNQDGVLTCTSTITRPADTNAYTAGDALSNSTSAPTAGGGTFTSAARAAGKSVILTDLMVVSSAPAATPMQGILHIFDTAPTAINDNAAFSVSDAQMLTCVARVPFTLVTRGVNSAAHVQNINCSILTVGSADLRFLIEVTNAYTPESTETLSFRAKFMPVN